MTTEQEPALTYSARTLAALTANPGCARRALLDTTGADKAEVAGQLGFPMPSGQSRFAITRGNAFEAQVKADLLAITGHEEGRVAEVALRLEVAGQVVGLEPDALLVEDDDLLFVVLAKSFPIIDGRASPEKVSAAARQAAVYVLALQRMGRAVSEEVILVCPENFSNKPVAAKVDVRRQLSVLARQLDRLPPAEGDGADPVAAAKAAQARYAPECLAACELAFFCRDEARREGATDAMGRSVRDELGGVSSVGEVLRQAMSGTGGGVADDETAELLSRAWRLRQAALASTAGTANTAGMAGVAGGV
ncbi:hypothetical protein [Longispora albida]|uniref:hypothetical protein n=1 Tax=Longispora albida TaxID=203523 RepID=UPI000374B504|nr:hypothetical protein [Longispora albida]